MEPETLPLVVGLPGPELSAEQRAVLQEHRPAGVILFTRNIETPAQVRLLVEELQRLEPEPFVAIDLEGGAVNRLAGLWGTLPSAGRAAAAGRRAIRSLGQAAGAACRSLGIHLDLAPVVDLECCDGLLARQSRCLSDDPERVATLAQVFNEGLAAWCVSGCLKHFPGLGAVAADTHEELPSLDLSEDELQAHLQPFTTLAALFPTVMMAHVVAPALGEPTRPASLSPSLVERATHLPGSPVVLSDDIEMGALSNWGDLPERVELALRARNHGVLICKAFDRLPEIADHIRAEAQADPSFKARVEEAATRLGTLRRDLCLATAAVPEPDDSTVAQLWESARQEAEP